MAAPPAPRLPAVPAALLRALLPLGERDEVLDDLAQEHADRAARDGGAAARRWLWGQVLGSVPSLLRRSWWRGWSGFEPRANRLRPGGPPMESWIMDARFAARRLRARPAYTLLAVLTLALGVGGTAAIYGVARKFLLDPLPFRDESSLVVFWNAGDWSEAEVRYLRPDWGGFQQVAAYRSKSVTVESPNGPPQLVPGLSSSAELFDVLGVRPMLGNALAVGSDLPGAEPSAVLSHDLWKQLGGDPNIVGKRLKLDGVVRTVSGVMPSGFWFPDPTVGVWLAESLNPENRSGNYTLIARMPPGRTPAQMEPALTQITARLRETFTYPAQWDKTRNAALTPIREVMIGPVRPALLATWAAMAAILLIACANVAALMLGQVDGQSTELAVRSALGAGRRRLVQQLAAEALMVGALAGVVGALLAAVGFHLLRGALPLGALAESAALDWRVFATAMVVATLASLAVATLASLAVALVPGVALLRGDLQRSLSRGRTAGVAGRGGRMESGLVVVQVALAMVMALGAALLIRSVANLSEIDPGVERNGVAVVDVATSADVDAATRGRLLREMTDELRGLPGVASVAAVQRLPLRNGGDNWGMKVEGRPDLPSTTTAFRVVSSDYFATLGIRVRRGRGFTDADGAAGEPLVVVNEALVAKYFAGEDPLGRRIDGGTNEWARIVGVVENVAEAKLTDEAEPARYMLYDHVDYAPDGNTLLLRMQGGRDPSAVLQPARRAIYRVAPTIAMKGTTTMEAVFAESIGPARQVMALLTLLGGLALTLGAVGVFGVVSHFVTRRRRDWGIRMALGMQPRRVVALVVGRGAALVAAGVVLGTAGSVLLARWLATFLYGVGTVDPLALAVTTAILLTVGLAAAFLPARRASRIDPAVVLRDS